jgi:hypothetical protein
VGGKGMSIYMDDMEKAKQLKKRLEKTLDQIDKSVSSIFEEMSGFNAPGMKTAFIKSIKKGMSPHTNMFMVDSAKRELDKYYQDRG